MIFTATDREGYCQSIQADDWQAAHEHCDRLGWELDGELIMTIPADQTTIQSVIEFCRSLNCNSAH